MSPHQCGRCPHYRGLFTTTEGVRTTVVSSLLRKVSALPWSLHYYGRCPHYRGLFTTTEGVRTTVVSSLLRKVSALPWSLHYYGRCPHYRGLFTTTEGVRTTVVSSLLRKVSALLRKVSSYMNTCTYTCIFPFALFSFPISHFLVPGFTTTRKYSYQTSLLSRVRRLGTRLHLYNYHTFIGALLVTYSEVVPEAKNQLLP